MVTLSSARPRVRSVPEFERSLGGEAVELMRGCGVELDAWQVDVLEGAMGLDAAGRWSAFEVGVNVPRQNGKDEILQARALTGLFVLGERLVLWSSQQQDTSTEALYRMVGLIEDNPDLAGRVRKVMYANGKEAIWLTTGERIYFMTRSKSRARSFTGDLVIFNEAMFLADFAVQSMLPTLSTRPMAQVYYAGTAVDQEIHEAGVTWARVRERGMRGAPRLAYTEFSHDAPGPLAVPAAELDDPEVWAAANPALDARIERAYVENERQALTERAFAVERLGVGDWPRTDFVSEGMVTPAQWADLCDTRSELLDPVVLFFDVSPDRRASISAAGRRPDGLFHVEVIRNQAGTKWVVPTLIDLAERHEPALIGCDGYGAESLISQCEEAGLTVKATTAGELAQACGRFVDAVREKAFRHLGSGELAEAVKAARTRPLGDAGWAWSRKSSLTDISPLVSSTLALAYAMDQPEDVESEIW